MTDMTIKTPWHLWLVGVIAVLFNAIGVLDSVMSMAQGATYMTSAGMTPAQIAHYQEMPIWMTVDNLRSDSRFLALLDGLGLPR